MDNNSDNVVGQLEIKSWLYRCLYFCLHFYEVYCNKRKIDGVFARFQDYEAIFMCQDCRSILSNYISFERSIFFHKVKKKVNSIFYSNA